MRWPRLSVLVLLATGCAPALRGHRSSQGNDAAQGWVELAGGHADRAAAAFDHALAVDRSDARALFGLASLAYERADDETALGRSLDLLEAANRGDDVARALATATLARVPRLLAEIPDRRPAEERLLALAGARLPWAAQYALALVTLDIARLRGDAALLRRNADRVGCVGAAEQVGVGGRLPLLDLATDGLTALVRPRPLLVQGCQLQLNTEDGRPGVKVLRADLELAGGRYAVVLDFGGAARLRVDGGSWYSHAESMEVYGPRWTAVPLDLSAGKHTVEVRVGLHGASAELGLLAIPVASEASKAAEADSDGVMDLAAALAANLVGDSDRVLASIDRMTARPRFALGQAAAGRLGEMDKTRPGDVTRDKARALAQLATAIDPRMARVWLDLSRLDMENERPREAAEHAESAREAAPLWWPAHLALASALRAQGLEEPADRAMDAGLALVAAGHGGCQMIEKALQRKQDRNDKTAAARLIVALNRCDAQSSYARAWAQDHGDLDKGLAALMAAISTSSEPLWLRSELADLRVARGELPAAAQALKELSELAPRDARAQVRLADLEQAQGNGKEARARLAAALRRFPTRQDVRQAARLAGIELPLDRFRLDGGKVVADFLASGRRYDAPAVVVLDRAVEQVFFDGSRLILTHTITQVLGKDAIEHVGEVQIPRGAEVLALRTRKVDGTVREAEEIPGKPTISAPNLGVGDFVESETLEFKEPRTAFAPGFIGERFYFQSFDAPLDRSEYVLVAPLDLRLEVNRRGAAPAPVETRDAAGARVLTFIEQQQPQLFAERAAVPPVEWIPSVRIASGITLDQWSRYVAERFAEVPRRSPQIRRLALDIAGTVNGKSDQFPRAIATWVRDHIEPESDLTEPATSTLARGRGNRAGLMIALARSLGVRADVVLARSRFAVDADAPVLPGELDDFRDVLVRFHTASGERFVDPQLRRAPFGYLHAGIDGAKAVVAGTSKVIRVASAVADHREVRLHGQLAADGSAELSVTEDLSGWPAVEWSEMLDRAGKDRAKLRQAFEQYWLGQHFPGAALETLEVAPAVAGTQVRYTFKVAHLADVQEGVLRLRPTFFRSQPGRRFATEPGRKTALALGYDVPLDVEAELLLPAGATVLDVGAGGAVSVGNARFVEERRVDGRTISLRRSSRLPLSRIAPEDYAGVAARLRTVDPVEQGEIRIAVAAP